MKTKKIFVPAGNILNKGEVDFRFSAVQDGRFVIESPEFRKNSNTENNQGDVVAAAEYGLTDNLSFTVGASHINNARVQLFLEEGEKVDQNFVMTGFKTSIAGIGVEYDTIFTHDSEKSPAHYFSIQTGNKFFNVMAQREQYNENRTLKSIHLNEFLKLFKHELFKQHSCF